MLQSKAGYIDARPHHLIDEPLATHGRTIHWVTSCPWQAASPWSAHLPEADIAALRAKVGNGPRPEMGLFDHFVGAGRDIGASFAAANEKSRRLTQALMPYRLD
ncbi:hypothetical protein DXU04_27490 [Bradyrhizobium diazoefficiens]|nr:hypothetical protein BD122_33611 [Bradyrhizobium diazoefficiens]